MAAGSIGLVSRSASPTARPEQLIGAGLVVIAAIGFGSGPFFANVAYDAGMTAMPILFWRFLAAALLSWGFALASASGRASLRALGRRHWRPVAAGPGPAATRGRSRWPGQIPTTAARPPPEQDGHRGHARVIGDVGEERPRPEPDRRDDHEPRPDELLGGCGGAGAAAHQPHATRGHASAVGSATVPADD